MPAPNLAPMHLVPSYQGRGLVNLVAEIERRLTGGSPTAGLAPEIADGIDDADTYVLAIFDGLGMSQLDHPAAVTLAAANRGVLHAPFPTTTSVALATLATGLPPSSHGLVAHLCWLEELGQVVNTLKWVNLAGEHVAHEYAGFLPAPNLWERLRQSGVEPITVQPSAFAGSPLTRLLYRGARFEGAWDDEDLIEATVQLAVGPRRLIFTYVWQVDFAGHVYGLGSDEFAEAISLAARVWEGIAAALPPGAVLLGTADHGLVEYRETDKILIRQPEFDGLRFAGDTRGVQMWGDSGRVRRLAQLTGGELTDPAGLVGPNPTATVGSRLGDHLLLAPEGKVILPRGFDKRLRCYHGGLAREEVEIPLLVG